MSKFKKIKVTKVITVETSMDEHLTIQATRCRLTDYTGTHEIASEIMLGITDVDEEQDMYVSLTTSQARKFIEQLQGLIAETEVYNLKFRHK
ncbi:hypothetical protein [Prevotella sp. kh1p2]|uniref:hypothetical protein n=1 Tax=Prevotella sp. kh1p2 TaxID=1761883 RepID=UPI0008B56B0A|nr:hypothetical protein [Prevotella sp. kh1p2]SET22310.1 hypothetical protein SAMN04487825_12155 [Prevotella sp. kh1p2]SNU12291.1 hypothetical protein SAMN06298210_1229 [Prevotellaceae bacterium KH2P17]